MYRLPQDHGGRVECSVSTHQPPPQGHESVDVFLLPPFCVPTPKGLQCWSGAGLRLGVSVRGESEGRWHVSLGLKSGLFCELLGFGHGPPGGGQSRTSRVGAWSLQASG